MSKNTNNTPRSYWKGSIGFGLVNVPVKVYTAAKETGNGVSFRNLHECVPAQPPKKKGDKGAPAVLSTTKKLDVCGNEQCPQHTTGIPFQDLKKGYEYTPGQFVVLGEEDFAAASVEGSESIEITEFVPAEQIDARFFEKPYFVLPDKGGDKPYTLLREAIRAKGVVGLGLCSFRKNGLHTVAITVSGDALVISTMRWHEDIVPVEAFQFPSAENVNKKEVTLATQLVDNLVADFDPTKYENTYRDNLMGIIEAKMKGEHIEVKAPEVVKATPVPNLMDVLAQSVAAGQAARKGLAKKVSEKKRKSA